VACGEILLFFSVKKARSKDRAKRMESDWGVADSYGSRKGLSEPTPGYSVFTKSTSNYHHTAELQVL
jgi:hypothetical protein